ncbi:MAG: ATP-grasp domain-containing protein [Acidothermaceae bacterium]
MPHPYAGSVALATAARYRVLDADLDLAVPALVRLGIDAVVADWDDPAIDWSAFDLVVVRSTWDYTWRHDEFVAWVASVPRIANPASVLSWNIDKRYLSELAGRGVPVVPTVWNPASANELPDAAEWVVKPNVSAGSRDTARWTTSADVMAHARELVDAGRHAMVQPYLDRIDAEGETALLFFGGEFSHAVRKGPLLISDQGVVDVESRYDLRVTSATPKQRAVADAVLAAVRAVVPGGDALLYARVDLIPDAEGQPVLLELELTEPSLFLPHADGAADRFAAAVLARLTPAVPPHPLRPLPQLPQLPRLPG